MRRKHRSRARRGVATLWVILSLPLALCLLAVVIEAGNLLLARLELLNALEAAALAGADETGPSQMAIRNRAVELAAANTVNGQPVIIAPNNGNASCTGNVVILGTTMGMSPYTFNAVAMPPPGMGMGNRAVRVQGTVVVNSVLAQVCGMTVGPFEVTGHATARRVGNDAELIRVGVFNCP